MRATLRIFDFDFFFHNYYGNLGTALRGIEPVSIRRHRHIPAPGSPCFQFFLECVQAEFCGVVQLIPV